MKSEKNQKTIRSAVEIGAFCDEIALMLSAGVQLYDGLEALADTYKDTPRFDMYNSLSAAMNETGSLYEAMKRTGLFPDHVTEMTGIGERAGRLEDVMKRLSGHFAREKRVRDAIANAVTYPLVLSVMLVVIIIIMIAAVLPVFRRLLSGMGIPMTATGTSLMNIGLTAGWIVLAIVGAAVLTAVIILLCCRFGNKDTVLEKLGNAFPHIRRLRRLLSASRVCSVLSMMLSAGFRLDEALEMSVPALSDASAIRRVQGILTALNEGTSFGDALERSELLDGIHTRMVRMAVSLGKEDEVFMKISQTCEERLEDGISSLVSVIEPSLVALLCIVIGAILLSVMLPMAGIISGIL